MLILNFFSHVGIVDFLSSWVEPVLLEQRIKCRVHGHNALPPVSLKLMTHSPLIQSLTLYQLSHHTPKCPAHGHNTVPRVSFVLFDLILYVPSTIFQLNRDVSSWVEPVLS